MSEKERSATSSEVKISANQVHDLWAECNHGCDDDEPRLPPRLPGMTVDLMQVNY